MNDTVWCARSHRLVRFEVFGCQDHEHRVYCCPLRVGSRRCGEVVVVPPYGAACDDDERG